jgi:glyoxylase-like metal-dependent hydrolase (beta-lactamase superfamily II)
MGVFLVEITQVGRGFDGFIGPWLCTGALNVLVDVGPASCAEGLLASIKELGVDTIDYVLLTHIHLDHAGALSHVMKAFPSARAIVHEKAVRHLSDPAALWEGSRKVLGAMAEQYGRPQPVAKERLIAHTASQLQQIDIIETPGHAPHHLSFVCMGHLFAGEAGGNYFSWDKREYLRPATPPPFLFEPFLESIQRLMALGDMPICYGHFGKAESSIAMLGRFLTQVLSWKETIKKILVDEKAPTESGCLEALLARDPELQAFAFMDPAVRERERFFMLNSIRGFIGYLKK